MARKGETYLIKDEAATHLYFVVTESNEFDEQVIICNTTDEHNVKDIHALKMKVGDHPFINKGSVLFCRGAKLVGSGNIDNALAKGVIDKHACASPLLIKNIQESLLNSKFTAIEIKNSLRLESES